MAAIEFPQKLTAQAIYAVYEASAKEEHRPHLGGSVVGHQCLRHLWMNFRWTLAKKFEGRMLRLFESGHLGEERMAQNLRQIGVDLSTHQPGTKKQWTVSIFGGHVGGSLDGFGTGFPEGPKTKALWECKTSNESKFNDMKAKGVQTANAKHYGQMQIYMGLTKLIRCLYTMINKNTDEIYTEWVHFDEGVYEIMISRARKIISAFEPPEKISNDSSYWICKQCDYHKICHKGQIPEVNCRTCAFSKPIGTENFETTRDAPNEGGEWECLRWKSKIPLEAQRQGCGDHRIIPIFVEHKTNKFVTIDNVSRNFVYENVESKKQWQQGNGHTALTSKELFDMQYAALGADVCQVKADANAQGIYTAKAVGGTSDEP